MSWRSTTYITNAMSSGQYLIHQSILHATERSIVFGPLESGTGKGTIVAAIGKSNIYNLFADLNKEGHNFPVECRIVMDRAVEEEGIVKFKKTATGAVAMERITYN